MAVFDEISGVQDKIPSLSVLGNLVGNFSGVHLPKSADWGRGRIINGMDSFFTEIKKCFLNQGRSDKYEDEVSNMISYFSFLVVEGHVQC